MRCTGTDARAGLDRQCRRWEPWGLSHADQPTPAAACAPSERRRQGPSPLAGRAARACSSARPAAGCSAMGSPVWLYTHSAQPRRSWCPPQAASRPWRSRSAAAPRLPPASRTVNSASAVGAPCGTRSGGLAAPRAGRGQARARRLAPGLRPLPQQRGRQCLSSPAPHGLIDRSLSNQSCPVMHACLQLCLRSHAVALRAGPPQLTNLRP